MPHAKNLHCGHHCFYRTIQFYSSLTGSHSPCRALSATPLSCPVHFPPNVGLRNYTEAQTSRLSSSLFTRCLARNYTHTKYFSNKEEISPSWRGSKYLQTVDQKKINIKPLNHWKGLSRHNFFLWNTKGERSRNGKKEHPQTQRVEGLHKPSNRVALEGLPSPHPVLQSLRIPTKWSVLDVFIQQSLAGDPNIAITKATQGSQRDRQKNWGG